MSALKARLKHGRHQRLEDGQRVTYAAGDPLLITKAELDAHPGRFEVVHQAEADGGESSGSAELEQLRAELEQVARERDEWRERAEAAEAELQQLGILPADFPHRADLLAARLITRDAVAAKTDAELLELKGIGEAGVKKIRAALS